jgi:hypothetical protein
MHERKQEELDRIESRIQREKEAWRAEKQAIEGISKFENEIFKLDVGGAKLKVSKDTLTSVDGSLLQKMFSGKHNLKIDQNDVIYLDRDFKAFDTMIKYLRAERMVYPKFERSIDKDLFQKELDFWGIKTNNDHVEEKRLRTKLPKDLVKFLEEPPNEAGEVALKKWEELGSFNFRSIEKFSHIPDIEMDKKFG